MKYSAPYDKWVLPADMGFDYSDDGFDGWSDQVMDAFTNEFYMANEMWCASGQATKWMDRIFKKYSWCEPDKAARIIERAHGMWIKTTQNDGAKTK